MKVTICTLNTQYIHSSLAPFCLLAGLKKYADKDISAEVIQGTINENINDFSKKIIQKKPHAVGLSCYIWNIEKMHQLAYLIKKELPDTTIIMGGPEVSYNAEAVLRNKNIDYVLSGEGEKSFALLINALNNSNNPQNIPGLCLRDENKILVSPPCIYDEEPVSPYTEEYFHALNGKIAYIETSRGCPYSCAFCLSGRCGKPRFLDIKKAKQNIELLAKSGTKTIKFVDRTFNANKKHAKELILFIINKFSDSGIKFHFEIAGDILDDELISLFNSAPPGLFQLEIGLQTFNKKTLEQINRKTNQNKLCHNIKRLSEPRNIHIHIDLIAGLPYEDMESFKNSFNKAFELRPNMLQLGFLKLLYGSPMRENPQKYPCVFSENPPYEIINTPWLSEKDISDLRFTENALNRLYNSGRFSVTIEYILKTKNISPFDLFCSFGKYFPQQASLDELSRNFFDFFSDTTESFRDCLVIDRLKTNASGKLPDFLKRPDRRLKSIKTSFSDTSVKRGYAILYGKNKAVCAEYVTPDPVTGEYPLTEIPL